MILLVDRSNVFGGTLLSMCSNVQSGIVANFGAFDQVLKRVCVFGVKWITLMPCGCFTNGPSRIFKALILDGDNLVPKLLPQIIKSIEIVEGDGGAGTIKQMNFAEGKLLASVQFLHIELMMTYIILNWPAMHNSDMELKFIFMLTLQVFP